MRENYEVKSLSSHAKLFQKNSQERLLFSFMLALNFTIIFVCHHKTVQIETPKQNFILRWCDGVECESVILIIGSLSAKSISEIFSCLALYL